MSGRPSRAIFKSEPMGNSADSYNLTWKIDSYAPIEEYKLMFRKLFVRHTSASYRLTSIHVPFFFNFNFLKFEFEFLSV